LLGLGFDQMSGVQGRGHGARGGGTGPGSDSTGPPTDSGTPGSGAGSGAGSGVPPPTCLGTVGCIMETRGRCQGLAAWSTVHLHLSKRQQGVKARGWRARSVPFKSSHVRSCRVDWRSPATTSSQAGLSQVSSSQVWSSRVEAVGGVELSRVESS
jgi:hypothetical protein